MPTSSLSLLWTTIVVYDNNKYVICQLYNMQQKEVKSIPKQSSCKKNVKNAVVKQGEFGVKL